MPVGHPTPASATEHGETENIYGVVVVGYTDNGNAGVPRVRGVGETSQAVAALSRFERVAGDSRFVTDKDARTVLLVQAAALKARLGG